MKPRLRSAPPTREDSEIWLSIIAGYYVDWATVGVIFRDGDRRDADLMLELTLENSRRQYLNLRRYALSIGGTSIDWPDWVKGELP